MSSGLVGSNGLRSAVLIGCAFLKSPKPVVCASDPEGSPKAVVVGRKIRRH